MIRTKTLLYFSVGLLSAFCVRVIGIITLGEVLVILYALWWMLSHHIKWNATKFDNQVRVLITLLILCTASAGISNLLCDAPISDILKGIGTIFLLTFSFAFFKKILLEDCIDMQSFLLGYGISFIIVNLYFTQFSDLVVGDRGMSIEFYKEEMYAYIICNAAFFINAFLYSKNIKLLLTINLLFAFLCLFGNSRANFLMLIITDFLLLCNYYITQKKVQLTIKTMSKWVTLLCILLLCTYKCYSFLAQNGYLGEGAKAKYELQSNSKGGIFSARSYIIRGFITIAHHPLGGIGIRHNVSDNEAIRREYADITQSRFRSWDSNILSHTAIFDWWIAYGILTFPFWVYVCSLTFRGLKLAIKSTHPLTALVLFSTLTLLWNMFNSPFGNRVQYGFSIILLIYFIYKQSENESA